MLFNKYKIGSIFQNETKKNKFGGSSPDPQLVPGFPPIEDWGWCGTGYVSGWGEAKKNNHLPFGEDLAAITLPGIFAFFC